MHSLFFLNYSWHPYKSLEPQTTLVMKNMEAFASWMERVREDVLVTLVKVASMMKQFYDLYHSIAPEYKAGNLVYLEASHLHTDHPSWKLDDHQLELFKVVEKIGPRAFHLKLSASWSHVHPVFHTTLL